MNSRYFRRALLSLIAAAMALASGLGCLPKAEIGIAGVDFTPAFTLDRHPVQLDLTGQPVADPNVGPYRRAPGEIASLLYPDVDGIEGLLQADCFWAGRGPSGGGDLLRLNWEAFVWVAGDYDGKYLPAGDEDVSSCRLNDPLTRQPKHFSSPNPSQLPSMIVGLPGGGTALGLSFEDGVMEVLGYDFAFDHGVEWYGVSLEAIRPAAPHPDRVCDLNHFNGPVEAIGPGTWSYDAGGDSAGRVAFCSGQGRKLIAQGDARFRASLREGGVSAEQWFDAVMVAENGERLVRPATVGANGVTWSVAAGGGRWSENFSPSLRVEEVRLLRRSGGGEGYLQPSDLDSQTLCVRPSPGDVGCLYELASQTDANGDAVWRPLAPAAAGSARNLTPGYDTDVLAGLNEGATIADPLEWKAEPGDPIGVFFEFRLSVVLAPVAVRIDSLSRFGQVPPGETRYRRLTLTNVGGRGVVIDAVSVIPTGSDPGEFTAMVLGDPQPVPVGIEIISDDSAAVKLADDYGELPFYRAEEYETATLLLSNDLSGQAFEINGHELAFDGPTALHTTAGADFQPPYQPERTRPMNFISNLPLPLPQNLPPGDNLSIRVRFEAGQPGEKTASVQVDFHDPTDGTPGVVQSSMVATALWGPDPAVYPGILILNDSGPGQNIRNLLLINNGDMDLKVYDHAITGTDSARINAVSAPPASFQLPPTQLEVFTLEYLDVCAPPGQFVDHEAELWLDTDVGELAIPIRMHSQNC